MLFKLEMTSREIADLTGKRHDNVVRDIEAVFTHLKIEASTYRTSYQDSTGRTLKMYRLDNDLTMPLVTKYDVARRYAVVRAWRELEEQAQGRPLTLPEVLELNKIHSNEAFKRVHKKRHNQVHIILLSY